MMDLNKEAEEYAWEKNIQPNTGVSNEQMAKSFKIELRESITDYITGANSKFVQQEKIKAQIKVWEEISTKFKNELSDYSQEQIIDIVDKLKKQLES